MIEMSQQNHEDLTISSLIEFLREFSETQGRMASALEALTSATHANTSSVQELTVKLVHFESRVKILEEKQHSREEAAERSLAERRNLGHMILVAIFAFALGLIGTNIPTISKWLVHFLGS